MHTYIHTDICLYVDILCTYTSIRTFTHTYRHTYIYSHKCAGVCEPGDAASELGRGRAAQVGAPQGAPTQAASVGIAGGWGHRPGRVCSYIDIDIDIDIDMDIDIDIDIDISLF